MTLASLGKITVPTPGTPVRISANSIICNKIILHPLPANLGVSVSVGSSNVNAATYVGAVVTFIKPGATGVLDFRFIEFEEGSGDPLDLSTLWVDATTAGDGVIVSYAVV